MGPFGGLAQRPRRPNPYGISLNTLRPQLNMVPEDPMFFSLDSPSQCSCNSGEYEYAQDVMIAWRSTSFQHVKAILQNLP